MTGGTAGSLEVLADGRDLPGWGPWRSADHPGGSAGFGSDVVERTVGERFFDVAGRFSERVAVRSPSGQWTYSELASRVGAIAGGIRGLTGSRNGLTVALMADHDGPLVAGILGIISAGQVVVILDPAAPTDQIETVLGETSPVLLVSDEEHREAARSLATAGDCEYVELEGLEGPFDCPEALGWRAPAILGFTSGTTGMSKAAVVNHGVLLNIVRGGTKVSGIGPDDRMPMLFPSSLALAAYSIFLPLLTGGSLATLDVRSVGLAPLPDFLIRERITFAVLAPTVVRFLSDSVGGRSFPDLRIMGLGGEPVDAGVLELTCELFGCEHVAIGYGTTETGTVSMAVYHRDAIPEGEVSCGYPVEGVEIRVLDSSGAELGAGEVGEIAVLSEYLFDGYLGDPELSRSVIDTVGHGSSAREVYRTGDIGRLDGNGALTVVGRNDRKVKVRGRFVVLGDVEADLRELDGVADAAVTYRELGGVAELVGYVVPEAHSPAQPKRWRTDLLARREPYCVPSRWVVLEELPTLPNGKIDRRSFPEPEETGLAVHAVAGMPAATSLDERMRLVRNLWEELLPVGSVDDDEDFVSLGGDSLLAAQMLVLLEQRTGVIVPMGDLVHARTVRELAELLRHREAQQFGGEISTVSCVQAGDETSLPLVWFVHDLHGSAYRVRHLSTQLGPDWPVWSFESPLLAGERNPHASLDTFAARYITDMRAVQPNGPYWLAGYSFGGICAFEMARQLRAAGESVAFLGVIDIGPGILFPRPRLRGRSFQLAQDDRRSPLRPWFGVAPPPPENSGFRGAIAHYRNMLAEGPLRIARHFMVRSGASRTIDSLRFELDLRRHGRVRPEWRLWYSWEEHWKLVVNGWDSSNTYPGRLDLFWAQNTASKDASLGWASRVKELRVHRFNGDHNGVLEPRGAPALASALRSVLDAEVHHD